MQGQRSLADYSPWGLKESHTTEKLSAHTHTHTHTHTINMPNGKLEYIYLVGGVPVILIYSLNIYLAFIMFKTLC